ncbi:MAG: hypothetical protein P8X65_13660 [Syntrophobacterales bacterium]
MLNAVVNKIENDPKLKDKVKVVAAAQGQGATNARMWEVVQKTPFPVVPDEESKLGNALNFNPYPVTVLLNKSGKVLWVHIGAFEDADVIFQGIKKAVK